jgi:DNA-binding GntR family transcriptional regulator
MDFKPDELRWQAVADEIHRRITAGEYRPGMPIPGEPRLAIELGISKGTARRALNALIVDGTLYTVIGKGTFVSHPQNNSGQNSTTAESDQNEPQS